MGLFFFFLTIYRDNEVKVKIHAEDLEGGYNVVI